MIQSPPTNAPTVWLFVANTILHLSEIARGEESWWCVDRRCKVGDQAFIYKPLKGIILRLEVRGLLKKPEMFCNSYQMATATVKLLDIFDPPVTAKDLKSSPLRGEKFVRGNFQGTSFIMASLDAPGEIQAIAEKLKKRELMASSKFSN